MEKAGNLPSSSSNGMSNGRNKDPHVTKRQRGSEEGDSDEDMCGLPPAKKNTAESQVYQFKVTLKRSKPRIWRRIQVPANYNFWDLHAAIQQAMGWTGYHMHRFQMLPKSFNPAIGVPSDESSESEEESGEDSDEDSGNFFNWFGLGFGRGFGPPKTLHGRKVGISEYFSSPGAKADYMYDFGDGWEHTIMLEKIVPAIAGISYPRCIAGKQACPPEDCGGIDSYKKLLQIISNPSHKEYEEQMESLGGHFDPVKFDPKAIVFHDPNSFF